MSKRTFWDEPRPSVMRCHECGEKVPAPDDFAVDAQCSKCKNDLHCCRNCTYFDPAAEKECRQAIPERIAKKRAANACALFKPSLAVDLQSRSEEADSSAAAARRALDDLFK